MFEVFPGAPPHHLGALGGVPQPVETGFGLEGLGLLCYEAIEEGIDAGAQQLVDRLPQAVHAERRRKAIE